MAPLTKLFFTRYQKARFTRLLFSVQFRTKYASRADFLVAEIARPWQTIVAAVLLFLLLVIGTAIGAIAVYGIMFLTLGIH